MLDPAEASDRARNAAEGVLRDLGLTTSTTAHAVLSGHKSSIPIPCTNASGEKFLLKYFVPPPEGRFYPPEVRLEDYARREAAFYRLLDTLDRHRKHFPAPRTILIDTQDPPRFLLLQRITSPPGPVEEVVGSDHVFELLERIRWIRPEVLLGRRDFPVNRWDAVSYRDRVRMMSDPVAQVVGARRWSSISSALDEALRWMESRAYVFVHGDFTEQNIVVDDRDRPLLVDFERVGAGSEDHDLACLLANTTRGVAWRQRLLGRYFERRLGSRRLASEWGLRAAWIYLALRRLRFGHLAHGEEDPARAANLALLDTALAGGREAFPA